MQRSSDVFGCQKSVLGRVRVSLLSLGQVRVLLPWVPSGFGFQKMSKICLKFILSMQYFGMLVFENTLYKKIILIQAEKLAKKDEKKILRKFFENFC